MFSWLTHSCYSFLQGASTPAELVEKAEELGFSGLCLTDFDGYYGLVKGFLATRNLPQPHDFRMFYGVEILMDFSAGGADETDLAETPVFLQDRVTFVATDKKSYAQIAALITHSHRHGKIPTPISVSDDAAPWPENAIIILPGRGSSQTFSPAESEKFENWKNAVVTLAERFEGNFYLALTPPASPLERLAFANHIALHQCEDIPCVATPDVFFHTAERKTLHDILTSIRMNEPLESLGWALYPNGERRLHSPVFYRQFFERHPMLQQAFENNSDIAQRISFCLSELTYQYPQEFIPAGMTSLSWLKQLVWQAAEKLYAHNRDGVPQRLSELLRKELELVEELGFADYFLTVFDIVRWAREERRILCQGRGSAANSAICYVLGITPVDPMCSDVLFERFISRERGEPPDIDVDFEHERREEVIQYIYERYGEHRAAMVANVITFRSKGAYRAVGKALEIPDEVVTLMQEEMKLYMEKERAPESYPALLRALTEHSIPQEKVEQWFACAEALRGFPRHLGIHSGGFVISNQSLFSVSPLEPATMEGRVVIQFNKDDLEALGLFKIDILALGMLSALRRTYQYLREHRRTIPGTLIPVTPRTIPFECEDTFRLLREARTTGTFQVESRAQMAMLPKLRPRNFYDVVLSISLVRPGPISGNMVHPYLLRRRGLEKVEYAHPLLKPILERTLGIPIFQEQVMRIAIAVGNFTPGEADELRRAMGAWKMTGNMGVVGKKLLEGMRTNGIEERFAEQIYRQIHGFAEYGFPESHATSFAFLAWAFCYLKTHFPQYFLCGLLNAQPLGFYSVHSLLQEGLHAGLKILPPCILESDYDCYVTQEGRLRLGLRIVNGINRERAEEYLVRREELFKGNRRRKPGERGPVLHELLSVMPFHADERVSLIMANTFAAYDTNRLNILWYELAGLSPLLDDVNYENTFPAPAGLEGVSADVRDDFRFTGTSLTAHPFALLKQGGWPFSIPCSKLTPSTALGKIPDGGFVTVGGLMMLRQSPPTAKGMVFITLEDEHGTMNLIIRPDVYRRYREIVARSAILLCEGKRQANSDASTVLVTKFHEYNFIRNKHDRREFEETKKQVEERPKEQAKNQPQDLFSF